MANLPTKKGSQLPAATAVQDADQFFGIQGGVTKRFVSTAIKAFVSAFSQGGAGAVTKTLHEKSAELISVRDFGTTFDGAVDNSSSMQNAISRCVAAGIPYLYVDADKVNLLTDVDCMGVRLECTGTVFSGAGRLHNNGGMTGATIAGIKQDDIKRAPIGMLCAKSSTKIFYKASATEVWVLARKARNGGYFRARILYNSFLTEGSVGGQSELWRCAQVQNIAIAYAYKKVPTLTSGTFTDTSIPLSSGGSGKPYIVNTTSTLNDYIEYSFTGNEVTLGLYQSSGSTTGATVAIDGVTVEVINLQQVTAAIVQKKYFTTTGGTGGVHTLRVTRTAGGGAMYVGGINIAELSKLKPGTVVDTLAYGVLGATIPEPNARDYGINGGATDYAFSDGNLLAGSVHGGELSDFISWTFDGVVTDIAPLAVGAMVLAESIVLEQRTNFGWDASKRFDTSSLTDFTLDGGWTFSCQMTARPVNGINLTENYTNLSTTNPKFTKVEYPVNVDTTVDGAKTPVGRTEYVRQCYPATGDRVESFMTVDHVEDSRYGGVHIWRSPGAYNKVYYAPATEGLLNYKSLAFTTRKQFS